MDLPTSTVYGYKIDPRMQERPDGTEVDLWMADRKYGTGLKPFLTSMSSGDMDLSGFCVDMNQLRLSSCVGNGTVESVEILNNIAGYKPVPLSREFIYALARNEEEDPTNPGHTMLEKDGGTYIRNAFDVLSRYGVCDEYLWPYDQSKVFTSPSLMAQRQALGHKIHSYYRIDRTGNDRLDDIISALRQRHPVVFGTMIEQSFEQLTDDTPVGPPKGDTVGGHCMVVVGYVAGNFIIKNSWGTGWAAGGFCQMTPDYLAWNQTSDIWVPTLGMDLSS
jgi:hypothetical protein